MERFQTPLTDALEAAGLYRWGEDPTYVQLCSHNHYEPSRFAVWVDRKGDLALEQQGSRPINLRDPQTAAAIIALARHLEATLDRALVDTINESVKALTAKSEAHP